MSVPIPTRRLPLRRGPHAQYRRSLRRFVALFSGLLLALSGLLATAPPASAAPRLTLFGPSENLDPVGVGTSYNYSFALRGNGDITSARATLTLSGTLANIADATPSTGSCTFTPTVATCDIGDIPRGIIPEVIVAVTPYAAGTVTATVTGTADGTNDVSGTESTTVTAVS
ncbi:hypothetical protein [Streptomyces sp. NPDC127108]|uniref:hypothetical protein n=1 Tax=Streptomyces sp. NPDC127108 TaxID=3345361 RepID=UPI0036279ADA